MVKSLEIAYKLPACWIPKYSHWWHLVYMS